jgi:hypothetical protein
VLSGDWKNGAGPGRREDAFLKAAEMEILDLEKRAAHLRGLVSGRTLGEGSPEGRALAGVTRLLEDVTRVVVRLSGRGGGSRGEEASARRDRPTFIACECPHCREDLFVAAEAKDRDHPDERRKLRVVRTEEPTDGSVSVEGLAPASLSGARPREFQVTCPVCGEVTLIREDPRSAAWSERTQFHSSRRQRRRS